VTFLQPSNGRAVTPTRVVLDANVLISAFLYGGRLARLADLIEAGTLRPCFTTSTFREIETVFQYPKFAHALTEHSRSAEDIVAAISATAVIVPDPPEIPRLLRDFPDNFLLACAVATAARTIVSGDKQVQALHSFEGIPILSPSAFLKQLGL